ncbi:MAG: hypothetical protein ACXVW6_08400 [Nocardioidaceae bacterium]
MDESKTLPRPRQVTVAAGMAATSCVLLVVALFDAMAQVRSPEMRDTVSAWLSRPPGDGLGLGVTQALGIVRGVVLFNGAVAAAAVVLAIFTLRRHNGARIAFTAAAAVLLFTSPISGGVFPMVAAASAVLLWSAPSRDWFAGRQPRPSRQEAPRKDASSQEAGPSQRHDESWPAQAKTEPQQPQQPGQPPAAQPGPWAYPFGSGPVPPQQTQLPPGAPYGYPPRPSTGGPGRRPASVTAAAWLTWIFAGLTVGVYLLMLVMLVALKEQVLTAVRQDPSLDNLNISGNQLIAALWVVGVVVIFWCLSAMVLAFLAMRRMGWARVLLAVSSGIAALFSLFATFTGAFFAILIAVACIATMVLMFLPDANAWFAGRPPSRPMPPVYGGPTYGAPGSPEKGKDERPDVW